MFIKNYWWRQMRKIAWKIMQRQMHIELWNHNGKIKKS